MIIPLGRVVCHFFLRGNALRAEVEKVDGGVVDVDVAAGSSLKKRSLATAGVMVGSLCLWPGTTKAVQMYGSSEPRRAMRIVWDMARGRMVDD